MTNNTANISPQPQPVLRDVTSTAKLFNFSRPVFMSNHVWNDCVDMHSVGNELAILQRLRHVLFMASSALRNRVNNVECDFRVQRVPSTEPNGRPESKTLRLKAYVDENDRPIVTITFPEEN